MPMTMEEIVIKIRGETKLRSMMDELKKLEMAFDNLRKGGWHLSTYLGKKLEILGLKMEMWGRRFEMWALSVMFFGMQIKRTFERLARDTVNTFMKITEGTTEAGRAFGLLQGYVTALKFTIGDAIMSALEPYIPTIISIIKKTMEWIEQNRELVGKVILVGIVLGSLLFFIGSIILGLKGLAVLFGKAFIAIGKVVIWFGKFVFLPFAKWFVNTAVPFIVSGAKTLVTKIGAAFSWLLAHPIVLLIAALVALFIAWDYNLGGIKENTFKHLLIIARGFWILAEKVVGAFIFIAEKWVDLVNFFIEGWNMIAEKVGLPTMALARVPTFLYKWRTEIWNNLYAVDEALSLTKDKFSELAEEYGKTRYIEDMFKRIGEAIGGVGEEFTAKIGIEKLTFPEMEKAPTTEITEVSIGDINITLPAGTTREQAEDIVDQIVAEIKRHGVK